MRAGECTCVGKVIRRSGNGSVLGAYDMRELLVGAEMGLVAVGV